ncbi:sigma-70 family RNA polymerase sigma factor [Streptomyces sp. NPDC059851]|uniref:sigma-70 family RNA polymerase sigma factor n=1 Tax=Streptomyces sp. NPDC059851 TaxID=3346971 RepID=UPI0036531C42
MSTSATARQRDLHGLTDAELCALLRKEHASAPGGPEMSDVMGEVFARHHSAVLAYARTCCRDQSTAHDLAAEAFARTYRAVAWGAGPEHAWRPYLLTCVRRVAADWLRRDARNQLSDDFEKWAEGLADGQDVEDAVVSAEEGSLVSRAYRSLPERWQAVLWHAVVEHEPAADTAQRLGISAGGVGSLAARAREGLREAYLRAHLDQAASDECRHYGRLLAASLRRPGKRVTRDLRRHLQDCADCTRAERDLRDVNGRLGALLLGGILLWNPGSFLSSVGGHGTQLVAAKLGGAQLATARFGAAKWAVTVAAVAGTAVTAVVSLPADERPGRAGPALMAVGPGPGPATPPDAVPTATPSPLVSATARAAAPTTATPSAPTATPAPDTGTSAPPSPSASAGPAGHPLVNVGSGLCVGVAGGGSGGVLQLQPCTGDAAQGWQRLPAGPGRYQMRNTGTGTCLDGTTAGGNNVAVTLRTCRSDTGRDAQLWKFEQEATPGTFRLWFVPRVPRSDYPNHLLGPQEWPRANPPRPGSRIVHLPNYYDSASFLFTMG